MSLSLGQVVPWGCSFDEYIAMFALTPPDFRCRILGCGDGPAVFNAVVNRTGGGVVSVDPLYELSAQQIREQIDAAFTSVLAETEHNKEELGQLRRDAMSEFLADYEQGVKEFRYVAASLPFLPFMDKTFELALCSHSLFLYGEQHGLVFHIESIKELIRVADEVRIFPLVELGAHKSRHLDAVLAWLAREGIAAEIVTVDYEFQQGGNQMLRIGTAK